VDKNFVKGYFRQATALKNSGQTIAALEACNRGLGVDSANKDLKSMKEELNEVSRMERVRASIEQAKDQVPPRAFQYIYTHTHTLTNTLMNNNNNNNNNNAFCHFAAC
jgi:aldehyde:ferredoxin oxidoreductase